jgi:hypothetical protein
MNEQETKMETDKINCEDTNPVEELDDILELVTTQQVKLNTGLPQSRRGN